MSIFETPLGAAVNNSIWNYPSAPSLATASLWPNENGGVFIAAPVGDMSSLSSRYTFETWLEASHFLNNERNAELASRTPPTLELIEPSRTKIDQATTSNETAPVKMPDGQEQEPSITKQIQSAEQINTSLSVYTTNLRFSGLKPNASDMFLRDATDWSKPEYKIKTDARGYASITITINTNHVYWGNVWAEKDKTAKGDYYKLGVFLGFKQGSKDVSTFAGSLVNAQDPNARLGSWVGRNSKGENQVHFAKAAEATALAPILNWTKRISHLSNLVPDVENGSRTKINEMKDNYKTWSKGRQLLRSLGDIVFNGSSFAGKTFWGSFNRLKSAIRFDEIVGFIKQEGKLQVNPIVTASDSRTKGLTIGTAAFQGFIWKHPEVNGNLPIPIMKNGKIIQYNKTFSLWVRETMISLNYSITGNFGAVVKSALKKAADGSDLGFLIDGKNDAWDPVAKKTRPAGRELQVEHYQLPPLPVLDIDLVNGYVPAPGELAAPQLVADIQTQGMAAQTAAATTDTIFRNGISFTLRNPGQILFRAHEDRHTLFMSSLLEFLAIPGVLVTGNIYDRNNRARPLTQQDITRLLFTDDNEFDEDIFAYFGRPTRQQEYDDVRIHFSPANPRDNFESFDELLLTAVAEGRLQNFRLLNTDQAMRLINTLIIGNEAAQGVRFLQDPWRELADEEIAGIRGYQRTINRFPGYMGNANVQRFAYNADNLIMLIRNIAPNCIP